MLNAPNITLFTKHFDAKMLGLHIQRFFENQSVDFYLVIISKNKAEPIFLGEMLVWKKG